MKKRILFIALAVVLALSVGLIGCTAPPTQQEEEEEEPGVIEIKCAHTIPPVEPSAVAWIEWGDMIEEEWAAMKGADEPGIEFTYYWSMSLLTAPELYDGVKAGTADMVFYPIGVNPGLFPMNEVFRLCFLFNSLEEALCIGAQAYQEGTVFVDELEGDGDVKFITAYMMAPMQLHMATANVTLPADIAGRPIGAEGEILDFIAAAGGTPVETPVHQLAQNLDLGIIEGNIAHYAVQNVFGGLDYTTYHTEFGTAGTAMIPAVYLFNQDTWDSLPSDLQDLIMSKSPEFSAGAQAGTAASVGYVKATQCEGHTFNELTESQIDEWRALAVGQHDAWKAQSAAHEDAYDLLQSFIANCP